MQSKLFSIRKTATALNVSTSTIRRLIDKGLINATRVGGRIKISTDEIDRYIHSSDTTQVSIPPSTSFSFNSIAFLQRLIKFPKKSNLKYTIPTLNSIEAETLETFITEEVKAEEIFAFLKESSQAKLSNRLKYIMKEKNLDVKKSLILLFTDEAISNLQAKRQLLTDVMEVKNALIILPVPPHIIFNVLEFIPKGQIINTDGQIPPHLESYEELITDISEADPIELHSKFLAAKVLIMDGMKVTEGVFIRRNIAYLVAQYLHRFEKIYIHFIPHIPKNQQFTLLSNKSFIDKIVQI